MSASRTASPGQDALFYVRSAASNAVDRPLPELARVVLLASAETLDGVRVQAGAEGTIVAVWKGGAAYEIEFTSPVAGVATVRAEELRLL